jgi:hypothetical protein
MFSVQMAKYIAIATLFLCVVLLSLSQPLSQLALEHKLPVSARPSHVLSNLAATFNNFVCSECYEPGQGS